MDPQDFDDVDEIDRKKEELRNQISQLQSRRAKIRDEKRKRDAQKVKKIVMPVIRKHDMQLTRMSSLSDKMRFELTFPKARRYIEEDLSGFNLAADLLYDQYDGYDFQLSWYFDPLSLDVEAPKNDSVQHLTEVLEYLGISISSVSDRFWENARETHTKNQYYQALIDRHG